jgi:ATP-binding cassette subfamily B protein
MVDNLPLQLDEPVRERGVRFSVGERQLLSFARAIIRDPAILVLDEATAHVDTATERQLQQSVENISRGRTMIVIAHRLSTIEGSDQILVLDNGEILESGTHAQLMAKGEHYRGLYEAQFAQAQVHR